MNDGAALLAAILAQPEEDTPRLVYADWLEENDQPERAEFIRLQLGSARVGGRERDLLSAHAHKWFAVPPIHNPEPAHFAQWWSGIRRGFREILVCSFAELWASGAMVFKTHPIRVVDLTDAGEPVGPMERGRFRAMFFWTRQDWMRDEFWADLCRAMESADGSKTIESRYLVTTPLVPTRRGALAAMSDAAVLTGRRLAGW